MTMLEPPGDEEEEEEEMNADELFGKTILNFDNSFNSLFNIFAF